jgi:adenylate cyclase
MLDAGIGVSAGPVVAGYIGAEERFEYTVIGDPVNEAARLSDLAKGVAGRVLASAAVLDSAHFAESDEWDIGRSVTLRGRSRPTRLGTPRVGPAGRSPAESELEPAFAVERSVRRIRFPRPLRRSRRLLVGALILSKAAKSARVPDKSEESE